VAGGVLPQPRQHVRKGGVQYAWRDSNPQPTAPLNLGQMPPPHTTALIQINLRSGAFAPRGRANQGKAAAPRRERGGGHGLRWTTSRHEGVGRGA